MKRTTCFVVLLLVGASPSRAELQLPGKCKEPELLVAAGERLAETCRERILKLDTELAFLDTQTKTLTTLSIVSAVLATGGAAALTGIPGVGTAIQATDPGAEPSAGVAGWQLGVGIATALFSASAAGFGTLATFLAPSPEEAGALQAELRRARVAANKLALVPALAFDEEARAKEILTDAVANCAVLSQKPRDGARVAEATKDKGWPLPHTTVTVVSAKEVPPPTCLRSLSHVKQESFWVGKDAHESLLLLKYTVDTTTRAVTRVCSLDDDNDCTTDRTMIDGFLLDFPNAKP